MKYENLTEKQRNELLACKTPEDYLQLIKAEGYELSDEEIKEVSGGSWNPVKEVLPKCPVCGSMAISMFTLPGTGCLRCVCNDCKHVWTHTPVGDL